MSVATAKMGAKMFSFFILFFVCVTLELQITSGTEKTITINTDDGTNTCTTEYKSCSLTVDGKPIKFGGEKGDTGFPGLRGPPGERGHDGMPGISGLKGERGENGEMGLQGPPGERGHDGMPGISGPKGERGENGKMGDAGPIGPRGEQGLKGMPGAMGPRGQHGEDGKPGLPGMKGLKGERGEDGKMGPEGPKGSMGSPGPVGPPGSSGMPGVCSCSLPSNSAVRMDTNDDFGTFETPADVPCKSDIVPNKTPSGNYYLGPTGQPFWVYCNMTSRETCIRSDKTTPVYSYDTSRGQFWLTSVNVHMRELYTDISSEQLNWLRFRSMTVRQTIKYNCFDSVPYPKHNVSSAVKLWAWNDIVIGPYPTKELPIFYSVPEDTDHCKEGSTEWKSTIIELQSSNVFRLPIVDLWVGDIRNNAQKMNVTSVELCFG